MVERIKSKWFCIVKPISNSLRRLDTFALGHATAIFWILGILYKFALDAMYVWAANPAGSADGIIYQPDFLRYIIAFVMYLILFAVLPKKERDTVTILLHLQFVYTVAPLLCFYSMASGSHRYMLAVFCCILIQTLVVNHGSNRERHPIHIRGIQNYVTVVLVLLTGAVLAVRILYNGFAGFKAFDLSYVYVMRANEEYPSWLPRLSSLITDAILPFLILYFLNRKQYLPAIAAIFLQILFYMSTGYKITLFILIPILFIYYFSKTGHLLKLLYVGLSMLCIILVFAYQMDQYHSSLSLGIYGVALIGIRAIFLPASIKFNYYGCFSHYPKIYFSDGLIGKAFSLTYPYLRNVGHVVNAYGGFPFGSSSSNTGYLGDAYAQLGFVGMLLMSILLAYIFRAIRTYDSRRNFSVLTALFAVYIVVLNDGALFTTLLTFGMGMAFLLVFIYYGKPLEENKHGIQC